MRDLSAVSGESPVMTAFREWKAAFDFVEGPATRWQSEEQLKPHLLRVVRLPAGDALDVCAKLTALTYDGQYFTDDDGVLSGFVLRDARAMTMGLLMREG